MKRRGPYAPMTPETWSRHIAYLQQALAHLKDLEAPEPPITLLEGGERGRTFRIIKAGVDPDTGQGCIYFEVQNEDYQPRLAPPVPFLVLSLLLAFGGGCSVNDNAGGLSYVRLFGNEVKLMLGRVLRDTGAGEVTLQDKTANYRNNDPTCFSKTTADASAERPMRSPFRGRQHAIATAVDYYRRNQRRSGIQVSEAEYVAILEEAFSLLDALYGGHSIQTAA